ncbi:MAG: hypothetical protein BGP04_02125 [Rhizobiales bacterium 62-17]|nr:hypothetical protein [Hyphomicrobiales bacterium]OJY04236.1 MAG: hypothetical protein BGP04_02125 [Rhizobiales bacterium 62-17]
MSEQATTATASDVAPANPVRCARPSLARRCVVFCAGLVTLLVVLVLGAGGYFYWRLSQGPIQVEWLAGRIQDEMNARLPAGYAVALGNTVIESSDTGPVLSVDRLELRGPDGGLTVSAPRATVSIDPLRLASGEARPRRLDLYDLNLRLAVLGDGTVALSAGEKEIVLPAKPPAMDDPALTTPQARLVSVVAHIIAAATAGASPLGDLEHAGIVGGHMVFEDQRTGLKNRFNNLSLSFDKSIEGADLQVSAEDGARQREVRIKAAGFNGDGVDGAARLDMAMRDISLDDIALAAGLRDLPFDFDMPLSGKARFAIGKDGALYEATGEYQTGAGFFVLQHPDHEPIPVSAINGSFAWQPDQQTFALTGTRFLAGGTQLGFSGTVVPPKPGEDAWRANVDIAPGQFGPERPKETDIVIERGQLALTVNPAAQTWSIDQFNVSGPALSMVLSARGGWREGEHRLALSADMQKTPVRTVMRLWPTFAAPETRTFLLQHLIGGQLDTGSVRIDLDPAAMAALREGHPVPEQALNVEFTVSDGVFDYLTGAPPLSRLVGSGRVTGKSTSFTANQGQVDLAQGRKLTLNSAKFEIPDQTKWVFPASVNLQYSGTVDAVMDFISRDALKSYGGVPIDPATIKGQVDGKAVIDMRLGHEAPGGDPEIRVWQQVSNLTIDKFVGKERLDQGTLTVTADSKGMTASGQGRLFGTTAKIDMRQANRGPAEATVSFVLDDAARAKQGWSTDAYLSGPVGVRLTALLGQSDKQRGSVELDLQKTAINLPIPGVGKPAGRASKATFTLTGDQDKIQLQQVAFDGGTFSAQGQIDLDGGGSFQGARLSQIKLSPGDDMRADIQLSDDGLKIVARGNVFDARPLLQQANEGQGRSSGGVDLDLKAGLVTGYNGQSLANVDLRLIRKGMTLRDLKMTARSGRAPVTVGMSREDGEPQVTVRTNDGGSLLSFFDYYKRMEGGQLTLVTQGFGENVSGALSVRDFVLRNEPALGRLLQEGVSQRGEERAAQLDASAVGFNRLAVTFRKNDGRFDIREAIINGPSIGMTLEGMIDYPRNRVNMSGTFVPAYGVNNLFSKVPLFGPILGGGTNEGLFGVNFRVSGPASAPTLNINPLSAIAPGFIRKIFGAIDGAQTPAPPASVPQRSRQPSMPMSITPGQ